VNLRRHEAGPRRLNVTVERAVPLGEPAPAHIPIASSLTARQWTCRNLFASCIERYVGSRDHLAHRTEYFESCFPGVVAAKVNKKRLIALGKLF
jgi:hypothetical protein